MFSNFTPRQHTTYNMDRSQRGINPDLLAKMYRSLFRIRKVEERIAEIYPTDKVKSPVHLSIGQEPPAVGVCEALRPGDIAFGTYRGHALYLAKGGDLKAMIAELYGKQTGCGKGKAGSMHLGDRKAGMMGTSAVVGTTIPHAVGYALAERYRKKDTVVVSFFGDGGMEEGVFHESINFASLMHLPVLFVCENNFYAINTPLNKRVPAPNYCERVETYKVPAARVGNNDVIATYLQAQEFVAAIRKGGGPFFLEVETYRWREHVGPGEDWHLGYRDQGEAESWIKRDEIARVGRMLDERIRTTLEREVLEEIDQAFAFAEASPFPDDQELYTHVYSS